MYVGQNGTPLKTKTTELWETEQWNPRFLQTTRMSESFDNEQHW